MFQYQQYPYNYHEEDDDANSQSSYGSHKNRNFKCGSHGGSQEGNFAEQPRELRYNSFKTFYLC